MFAVLSPMLYYFVLFLRFLTFNIFLLGLFYPCKPLVNVVVRGLNYKLYELTSESSRSSPFDQMALHSRPSGDSMYSLIMLILK